MTFCLGVAEAKLANNMVNQLAWGSKPSVVSQFLIFGVSRMISLGCVDI